MRCKQVKINLEALIDGDISRSLEQDLIAHMESCSQCGEYYEYRISLEDKLTPLMKASTRDLILPTAEALDRKMTSVKEKLTFPFRKIAYVAGMFLILTAGYFLSQHAARESFAERSRQILLGQSESSIEYTATLVGDNNDWINKKIYFKRYNGDEHSMELTITKSTN